MYANRSESIEISNKNDINSDVFSISFWAKSIPNLGPEFYHGDIISHASAEMNSGWFLDAIRIQNTSD